MPVKTSDSLIATDSRGTARNRRPKAKASDEYVSVAETRALLAGSAAARQQRLQAGDMISTDEAAEMIGTSRVTMNAWITKGRAIGLSQIKRGFRMPQWQFDHPMWEALPKVSKALHTSEGWALLTFLETPLGGLDGATPRVAIERGEVQRVVELASRGS